jgi:hypothetical protein
MFKGRLFVVWLAVLFMVGFLAGRRMDTAWAHHILQCIAAGGA